jgi:hypothetical protein
VPTGKVKEVVAMLKAIHAQEDAQAAKPGRNSEKSDKPAAADGLWMWNRVAISKPVVRRASSARSAGGLKG